MKKQRKVKKKTKRSFNITFDKQNKILIVSLCFLVILLFSSSYAMLTNNQSTDNVITIKSGNLTMNILSDTINLNNKLPVSDEEGLKETPTVITLTNTGTMKIEGYDVKLISETGTDNISTLDNKYIKYAISLDNKTYTEPKLLSSNNNIIYTGYNLDVEDSIVIYIKIWLDNTAGNNAINKYYFGSIKADLYQKRNIPVLETLKNKLNDSNSLVINETTYLSGSNESINFNYVWYSGKLWRITAINPDLTMKMITDDGVVAISYGNDSKFYDTYVYQFLNEDFLDTLYNYQDIIVENSTWNISATNDLQTVLSSNDLVVANVGLLNSYEYYMSYKNTSSQTGYLNIKYWWWLLNQYTNNGVWYVDGNSNATFIQPESYYFNVRPVVNLRNDVLIKSGTGTKDDPFLLVGDKEIEKNSLLNTRISGEFVEFDQELYRIVITEDNMVKLNKYDYLKNTDVITKKLSLTKEYGSGTTTDYLDYYLNNTWYNNISSKYKNMILKHDFYIKEFTGGNYKNVICNDNKITKECEKTTSTVNVFIGLPRYGEMFANNFGNGYESSSYMWLITPYNSSNAWYITRGGGLSNNSVATLYTARPSFYLKEDVIIKDGKGTLTNPFKL